MGPEPFASSPLRGGLAWMASLLAATAIMPAIALAAKAATGSGDPALTIVATCTRHFVTALVTFPVATIDIARWLLLDAPPEADAEFLSLTGAAFAWAAAFVVLTGRPRGPAGPLVPFAIALAAPIAVGAAAVIAAHR